MLMPSVLSDIRSSKVFNMSVGDRSPSILATFWYLQRLPLWQSTKPYFINVPRSALPEGQATTNEISEPVSNIKVRDIREHPASRDIDQSAFTFLCHDFSTPEHVFQDLTSARRSYVPEAEDWICNELGAEYVHTLALEVQNGTQCLWTPADRCRFEDGIQSFLNSPGDLRAKSSLSRASMVVIMRLNITWPILKLADYTPRYARDSLIEACGEEKARQFEKQRFQIVKYANLILRVLAFRKD